MNTHNFKLASYNTESNVDHKTSYFSTNSPLLLRARVTAAVTNPSKVIKRMVTKPPRTPPMMAAVLSGGTKE